MNTRSGSSKISGCFMHFVVVLVSITALCTTFFGGRQGIVYVIAAKSRTATTTTLTSGIIKRRHSSSSSSLLSKIKQVKTTSPHSRHHTIFSSIKSTNNGAATTAISSLSEAAAKTAVVEEEDSSCSGIYVDKPILRGQFHKYGAILYPFLFGLPLYFRAIRSASITSPTTANNNNSGILVISTILFNFAIESIMIISATLHTYKWKSNYWHMFTRKLDFTAIFFGIALIYSSLGKLLLGKHPMYFCLEIVVWISAIAGTVMKWFIPDCPHYLNGLIFVIQGWAGLPLVPTLLRTCHIREAIGLLSGAIFVTLGALAYSLQWPKPKLKQQQQILSQRDITFGPHELFHVSSLFMFLSFWYTMWFNVSSSTST
jgi:channel protein (hemolysin III family)